MKRQLRLLAWVTTLAMSMSTLPMRTWAAPIVSLESENSIIEGEYTTDNTIWYASFNNLEENSDYIVIISRSSTDPIAPDNLIYLQESISTDTGTLTVPFRAKAEDIQYAVVCRPTPTIPDEPEQKPDTPTTPDEPEQKPDTPTTPDEPEQKPDIPATPDKPEQKPDTPATPDEPEQKPDIPATPDKPEQKPDIPATPDKPEQKPDTPTTPDEPEQKPDTPTIPDTPTGDSKAIIILGTGVAMTAVAAGVVFASSPVSIKGTVTLADHTALPKAHISLLQDGKVILQTTTNDVGAFEFKVKRGNYELTVVYTNSDNQMSYKTLSVKAPVDNLIVTF